jgi:vacuolar-type H+-ATPase subunit H
MEQNAISLAKEQAARIVKDAEEQAAVIRKNSEKYAASVRKALAHDLEKALLLIQ